MRLRLGIAAAVLFAPALVAHQSQPNPFLGSWNISATGPDKGKIYFLAVAEKDGRLGALFLDRTAHATPVAWIRIEDGELTWQYGGGGETLPKPSCGPVYHARLENGQLIGHHETPGDPCPSAQRAGGTAPPRPEPHTVNWIGVRQPTWPPSNANGRHTYGKPITIVGPGVGKEVWTGLSPDTWQSPCEDRWTIDHGLMKNAVPAHGERPTCNPYTKERFSDFMVDADFNLDAEQNSGLYLRGRYELQMLLGENVSPATAGRQALMAIYGWKAADVYAGNPPGEWQILNAIVVGNHLTATLNGKRVHDNAVLRAFTGGALDADELAPGPIMIQGDHSRVTFRKLIVTPITKAGM